MNLFVDARNGMAGDIFVGGMLSLGADEKEVISTMNNAGARLGNCSIRIAGRDPFRLRISLEKNYLHLSESEGTKIIKELASEMKFGRYYSELCLRVFSELCSAEIDAHKNHPLLREHFHSSEAVLHEAQDIIIDIIGAVYAMKYLKIINVFYIDYIGVGSGELRFSHGCFEVPAPATKIIIEKNNLSWKRTEQGERLTPTGASILAGFKAKKSSMPEKYIKKGSAKGTRNYPQVDFYLVG